MATIAVHLECAALQIYNSIVSYYDSRSPEYHRYRSQNMPLEISQTSFLLRRSFYLRSSGHGEAYYGHYMQDLDSNTACSVLRRHAHLTLLQDAAVTLDSAKLNADLSQRACGPPWA